MSKFKSNKAFVLLYAVLVASVVLAIGFSLANIITKQIILSSLGQSSRIAYYAADGGRDCGLFWANFSEVITGSSFGSGTVIHCGLDNSNPSVSLAPDPILAGSSLLNLYGIDLTDYNYQAYALPSINFLLDGRPACAKVTVFSFDFDPTKALNYRTIVLSRGFNTGCTSSAGPRTVSRTVINTSTW
ncbi:MAG: hypothetical protein AAB900_00450 [Patescibacteria group bacterium]